MNAAELKKCIGGFGTVSEHKKQIRFILRMLEDSAPLTARLCAISRESWRGYFAPIFAKIDAGVASRREWYLRLFRVLRAGSYDRLQAAGAR